MPASVAVGIGEYIGNEYETGKYNPSHGMSGVPNVGSPNVFINGGGAVRVGDVGTNGTPEGDNYEATAGSTTVFINGKPAVRMGDPGRNWDGDGGSGAGSFVSGSSDVFFGG